MAERLDKRERPESWDRASDVGRAAAKPEGPYLQVHRRHEGAVNRAVNPADLPESYQRDLVASGAQLLELKEERGNQRTDVQRLPRDMLVFAEAKARLHGENSGVSAGSKTEVPATALGPEFVERLGQSVSSRAGEGRMEPKLFVEWGEAGGEPRAERMYYGFDQANRVELVQVDRLRLGENGRPELSDKAHIFRGELTDNGRRLTGYHLRPGGRDVGLERFDESTRVDLPNGCYRGRWRLYDESGEPVTKPNGNDLTKPSSFFPDDMSPDDVEAAIAEAYDDAVAKCQVDQDGFYGVGAGHPVRAWFDDNGKIVTAYPEYDPRVTQSAGGR